MTGLAKKGSGMISVTRKDGPNPAGLLSPPGPGEGGGAATAKDSGRFKLDRSVKSPPTHGPAK